jgi:hypothetical protein
MRIRQLCCAATLLLLCAAVPAAGQGIVWEMSTTMDGGKSMQTTFSYMPKKYRIVPQEGTASILRLDTERMMLVDYADKSYYEMSFAEMEKMMDGVDRQMQEMRKQMEGLPAEQRAMMEKMMKGHGMHGKTPEVRAKATGERKTISGYACTKYILTTDGKEDAVVWATKDVKVPDAILKQMGKDMEVFARRIAAMAPGGNGSLVERARTLVDGFPIRTERGDDFVTTVTKIEERNVPASEFEVPSGFRKEKAPMMGGEEE